MRQIAVDTFYNRVMAHDQVYSLMYCPYRDKVPLKDQIVKIKTTRLKWAPDKESFAYFWGVPGPDYNVYVEKTYGKGWAFTKEEIFRAWGEEMQNER